jgi:hypothetical protein
MTSKISNKKLTLSPASSQRWRLKAGWPDEFMKNSPDWSPSPFYVKINTFTFIVQKRSLHIRSYFCNFFYKTFHGKQLAQIRSIWSPWLKATKRRSVIYTQAIWLFLTIWQLAPGKYLLPRDDADPWGVNTLCWTPFCPKLSVFTLRGELSGKGSPRGSKLPPPRGQVNP